jgi:hypothetical protein
MRMMVTGSVGLDTSHLILKIEPAFTTCPFVGTVMGLKPTVAFELAANTLVAAASAKRHDLTKEYCILKKMMGEMNEWTNE